MGGMGQSQVCQRCGGSGMLRLGDQSFRTCLECLGQGRLNGLTAATTTSVTTTAATTMAALRQVKPATVQLSSSRPLNGAPASASAAR
jgi:DnaJ-class molecular chaperone